VCETRGDLALRLLLHLRDAVWPVVQENSARCLARHHRAA
jgi:hypothetical protein